MWTKLFNALKVAGEIAKNLLAVGALLVVFWATVVLFYGDAPIQRLIDSLTGNQRLGNAAGWIWLGDGQLRSDYQFALLRGAWNTRDGVEIPTSGAILRAKTKRNVRKEPGPWDEKVGYIVSGDCVEVSESTILGSWSWVKILPTLCSR